MLEPLEARSLPSGTAFGFAVNLSSSLALGFQGTAHAVTTDSAGNVYVTGDGHTGPGGGYNEGFVAKYSATGTLDWAVPAVPTSGSDATGAAIAVDISGNVYVTGSFIANLNGVLTVEAFVLKLDSSSGSTVWNIALGTGNSGNDAAGNANGTQGTGIAVDGSGNVYTTGYFSGSGNFAGPTLTATPGFTDAYVSKLAPNDASLWAEDLGYGSGQTYRKTEGHAIAVDGSGNVYTTGSYVGTGSFSGTGTGDTLTSTSDTGSGADAYVSKLNTAGGYVWAVDLGQGGSGTSGTGIAVDGTGNVYTTGTSYLEAYVTKLNSSGTYVWGDAIVEPYTGAGIVNGNAIALDSAGNIYANGTLNGSAEFSANGSGYLLSSGTQGVDYYVSRLDASGSFIWADVLGYGNGGGTGTSGIAVDGSGNVFTVGDFAGTPDFSGNADGSHTLTLASGDQYDAFLSKLTQTSAQPTGAPYQLEVVSSGTWLFSAARPQSWQQLSTYSFSDTYLSPNGPDVLAQAPGSGIFRWEPGTGWVQLSSASSASDLGINNQGDVVTFFSGSGIWRYEDATGWRQLSQSGSPSSLSMNSRGDLLAQFASGGIWRYEDSTGWQQLTPANTTQVGMNDVGEVFGVYSNGIWRYEDSTGWRQITTTTSFSELSMNNRGDLTAYFTGSGIWRYEDSTGWQQLSSATTAPRSLTLNDEGDLLALFSGAGIWRYQDASGWQQISSADPVSTAFDATGNVLAEYQDSATLYQTMWLYQTASAWTKVSGTVPS